MKKILVVVTGVMLSVAGCDCGGGGTPGVGVDPTSGLTTTEMGGTAMFNVVLTSQPTADVTIPLSSSDTKEGTVTPESLTFTKDNWSAPQSVTVKGVDDTLADGPKSYTIAVGAASSSDSNYNGKDGDDVTVTNTDNDTAGFTVNPTQGLTTTEAGGSATFTIALNSQPSANVTIGLTSDDTSGGIL